MDASPLKALPPELRNLVYEYLLCGQEGIHLRIEDCLRPEDKHGEPLPCNLSITDTCKELREESLALLYGRNSFIIHTNAIDYYYCQDSDGYKLFREKIRSSGFTLRGWLQSLGENARLLTVVDLALGLWETHRVRREVEAVHYVLSAIKHFHGIMYDSPTKFTVSLRLNWNADSWCDIGKDLHVKLDLSSLEACQSAVERALVDGDSKLFAELRAADFKIREQELTRCRAKLYDLLGRLEANGIVRAGT
ncbi:hypothetical protein LTR36_002000 [Oleoguttula mirabilis]|uniref:Uncharacterized protein n=1 Tax=Oleoguttula mirabilis TaxID=1507867 RepID=A0AAV9JM18_9PEZI|nr:hypothetical protein LTR36_002000 [Oleoguttula mirabilis]